MAAAPVLPIPRPDEAPLSEGARIVDTFLAPNRTFLDLRRNASWWAPYLLLSIASLGFFYTIDQKIGFRKVAENQIQQVPKAAQRLERLPPDQQSQAVGRQAVGLKYFLYGYPAVILLSNLIIAALLFATFRFAAGADLKFKTSYAIVMYASLPLVVKTILATVSLAAGANPDTFVLQNPVATNPGYFLSPADSPFLFSLASAVDVFMIWTLVLSAIGFAVVAKLKRSTALVVVFLWYLIFVLGSAGSAAVFS
jgi:Yip1 domain